MKPRGGWGGAGCSGTGTCTLTMDAARSVTATFTRATYVLTVAKIIGIWSQPTEAEIQATIKRYRR